MSSRAFKLDVPVAVAAGTAVEVAGLATPLTLQVQGTGWVATLQPQIRLRGGAWVNEGAAITAADIGTIREITENVEELRVNVTAFTSGAPALRLFGDLLA